MLCKSPKLFETQSHLLGLTVVGAVGVIGLIAFAPITPAYRITLGTIVFLIAFMIVISRIPDRWFGYVLSVPSLILLIGVTVIPIIFLIWTSVHHVTLLNFSDVWPFVGLENFRYLILEDPLFVRALVRSLQLFFLGLVFQLVIGMALALLLERKFRLHNLVSTMMLLPMLTNSIVVGILWKYMLSYDRGFINLLLGKFGIAGQPWLTNLGLPFIRDLPVIGEWLSKDFNMNYAFLSILLVNTWQWTPMVILLLSAGLAALPQEPFEAARVDGATQWQTFRYLTLPMLKSTIRVTLIIRGIDLMKTFGIIWALFGNASITATLNIHIFTVGMSTHNYGRGSALALILTGTTFLLYFLLNKLLPEGELI